MLEFRKSKNLSDGNERVYIKNAFYNKYLKVNTREHKNDQNKVL